MAVILACDYGRKRIGLAVSDPTETFVFPRETLHRQDPTTDLATLRALCAADRVTRLLVGLPLNADGTEGPMAKEARTFGARLSEALSLPVAFFDERYTSIEADERLAPRYKDPRERAARRDQAAAALILRSYLDREEG